MKEETYPGAAYMPLFILAPVISFIPALLTWAVIPFARAAGTRSGARSTWRSRRLPIGFLFILAIASLGVYGIVLAGWSSNNKYALLGGLRSSAQMISYEIAMGMSTIPVLLLAGNVSLHADRRSSRRTGALERLQRCTSRSSSSWSPRSPRRTALPFDLPEAESELIAGYHTEYSAMKFSMFFIAEYANMVTASALMATLFFGGWDIPFTLWDNVAPHTLLKTLLTLGVLLGEDPVLPLRLHLDPLDAAALPLRPAHGARLEVHAAAGARVHRGRSPARSLVLDDARHSRRARGSSRRRCSC